jgi:hypothetical protein
MDSIRVVQCPWPCVRFQNAGNETSCIICPLICVISIHGLNQWELHVACNLGSFQRRLCGRLLIEWADQNCRMDVQVGLQIQGVHPLPTQLNV